MRVNTREYENLYRTVGVMDTLKSAYALGTRWNYTQKGWGVILIKPRVDDKGGDMVVTRINDGIAQKADIWLKATGDVEAMITERVEDDDRIQAIVVDEVQFLKAHQIEGLKNVTRKLIRPVLTFGLERDFVREWFEGSAALSKLADRHRELVSICYCGVNKSTCNVRRDKGHYVFEGDQVAIEVGDTTYDTYCDECYDDLREAIEKERVPSDVEAGLLARAKTLGQAIPIWDKASGSWS